MSILSIQSMQYRIGSTLLFDQLSLSLHSGERVGLVGRNGSGKSTLLRILAGEVEPESGLLIRARELSIGYVAQVVPQPLLEQLVYDGMIETLQGGYHGSSSDYRIEALLAELSIPEELYWRPIGTLSGGEVNRVMLARAMLAEPQLLLLDEPTNHMDLMSIEMLERVLCLLPRVAVLVVSHDRRLLDRLTSRTLFLRDQRIQSFSQPYSQARAMLQAQDDAAVLRAASQAKEIERITRSAKRIAQWGRDFDNEKLSRKARSMFKSAERLSEQMVTVSSGRRADVRLETTALNVARMLRVYDHLVQRPDGAPLFHIREMNLFPGERIALIGRNGSGKSTFIKSIVRLWKERGHAPSIAVNSSLRIGYYDQELRHLDQNQTILESLTQSCELSLTELVSALARAGFPYQRRNDRVDVLSGGEQSRLSLLKLSLQRCNLLVLDEPTNHLDIEGTEDLERQLISDSTSCLFVSHDREFIERVATRVMRIEAQELVPVR